jgi:hypothetical protein
LNDHDGALKSFRRAIKLDKSYVEAELNAQRIQSMLRSNAKAHIGRLGSYVMAALVLLNMMGAWFMFVKYKLTAAGLLAVTPILLGLFGVALLLPWLSRLKMTGLEAELSTPGPKESVGGGPKGEIGFASSRVSLATPTE